MIAGTLAWTDFNQHKTNSIEAVNIPYSVQLHKYEKDIDGNQTTSRVSNAEFYLYKVTEAEDIQIGTRYTTDNNGKIIIDEIEPGEYYFLETNPSYGYEFDEEEGNTVNRYDFTIQEGVDNINTVVHAFNRRITGSLSISKEVVVPESSEISEITPFEDSVVEETEGNTETEETNDTERTSEATSVDESMILPFNNQIDLLQEFEFTVIFSDNGTYEYSIDGGTPQSLTSGGSLKLKHGQTAVFPSLPVGLLYTVTEKPIEGYIISGDQHQANIVKAGNTATFINTLDTLELGDSQLQITKVIKGNPPIDEANKQFEFTLTIDGVSQDFTLKAGETKSFPIPIGAVYEVIEKDYLSDGYSQSMTNGYGTATTESIQVTATNTFIGTEMIEIPIEKTWDFTNLPTGMNQSDVLPNSIVIYLKDGDRIVESATVKQNENGEWKHTFTAPKYEADDITEIDYTVEEEAVAGFTSEVDGFKIKNTYIAPATFEAAIVEKQIDGDIPETAEEFYFVLSANDGAPMPEDSSSQSKTVTISGSGVQTFGYITYTNPGTYRYTIVESIGNAEGYSYDSSSYLLSVVVEQQGNQLVVTSAEYLKNSDSTVYDKALFINNYQKQVPTGETIIISGEKTWNHGTNTNPPKSITLYILADGQRKISFTLDESSHWQYSFSVPKYNADGKEIVYTVEEEALKDYTASIDGFNITNTHTSVPDPNNPNGQSNTDNPDGVKTEDSLNIRSWIAMMIGSATMLAIMILSQLKKKYSK